MSDPEIIVNKISNVTKNEPEVKEFNDDTPQLYLNLVKNEEATPDHQRTVTFTPTDLDSKLNRYIGEIKETVPSRQPPSLSELGNDSFKTELKTKKTGKMSDGKEESKSYKPASPSVPIVNDDDDIEDKMKWIFKLELLKERNNLTDVPEFTSYSKLSTIKTVYNSYLTQVKLKSNITSNKSHMYKVFKMVEFVATTFFKIEMTGFADEQMKSLHVYDELLIEMGEKSYVPQLSKRFPVEVRLLAMVGVQALTFAIFKYVSKNTGINPSALFGDTQPKRKMRGPTMDSHIP